MSRNICAAKKAQRHAKAKPNESIPNRTSTDPHQIEDIKPSCRFLIKKIQTPYTHFSYSEKVEKVGIVWQSVTKISVTH